MDSISIGQYIPGNSWIYKMDPRMKIILTIALMILIFLIPNIYGMLIALGVFLVIFLTTGLSVWKIIKGLRPVLFLLIFTFVLQLIYNDTGTLYYSFNFTLGMYQIFVMIGILLVYFLTKKFIPFKFIYFIVMLLALFAVQAYIPFDNFNFLHYSLNIYSSGVIKGSFIFVRIILMVGITSLLTFTTGSMDINNGLSAVMSPLKVIHVPVGMISMTLSLTLRFIPTLLEETNKIMKAQASRGVDFNEGNLRSKIMQIVSLIIPMFVVSFKKADDLANAMIARGYSVDGKRTKLDLLKLRFIDYFALVITLGFTGLVIWSMIVW